MSTLARIQDSQVILLGNRPAKIILSFQGMSGMPDYSLDWAAFELPSSSLPLPLLSASLFSLRSLDLISVVSSKIDLIKSSVMNKEISLSKKIRKEIKKDVYDEVKKNQKPSHQVSFRKGATRQR